MLSISSSLLSAANGPMVLAENAAKCSASSVASVLPWDMVVPSELDMSSIRTGGSGSESGSSSHISCRVVEFRVTVPGVSVGVPANAPVAARISASAGGGGGCPR